MVQLRVHLPPFASRSPSTRRLVRTQGTSKQGASRVRPHRKHWELGAASREGSRLVMSGMPRSSLALRSYVWPGRPPLGQLQGASARRGSAQPRTHMAAPCSVACMRSRLRPRQGSGACTSVGCGCFALLPFESKTAVLKGHGECRLKHVHARRSEQVLQCAIFLSRW